MVGWVEKVVGSKEATLVVGWVEKVVGSKEATLVAICVLWLNELVGNMDLLILDD